MWANLYILTVKCQTVTLCRGSWSRSPSRLKAKWPSHFGHEYPCKAWMWDLQRGSNNRNLHGTFEPVWGVCPKWKPAKHSLEQPRTIGIVIGQDSSFKQRSRGAGQKTEDPRIYKFIPIYEIHYLSRCHTVTLCWIPSSTYRIGPSIQPENWILAQEKNRTQGKERHSISVPLLLSWRP